MFKLTYQWSQNGKVSFEVHATTALLLLALLI